MAIVRAVKSGNWSDTTVWNTGALPTAADDVYSNSFTVTIDISPTVLSISNAATTGVTGGGNFSIGTTGIVLTANISNNVAGNGTILSVTLLVGQTCSINGNVGPQQSSQAIFFTGNGTLTITGNIIGLTANFTNSTVAFSSVGTLNVIGNVSCGPAGASHRAISVLSTGTLNVTGNVSGATATAASASAIANTSGGTVNITGTVTGGSSNGSGVENSSNGVVNITGNVAGTAYYGCINGSTGTLTVTGTITASNTASGVVAGNVNSQTILTGPFITSANGVNPVYAIRWFWQNTAAPATYYQVRTANLTVVRSLYTADSVGGNPSVSNVRSGIVFGPSNELTGTCAVPPAGSVALGVPVDNTTGTAYLTQADIQAAATGALTSASAVTLNQQTSSLTTPGSIGERLKLASTVATTAQQLSDALSNE